MKYLSAFQIGKIYITFARETYSKLINRRKAHSKISDNLSYDGARKALDFITKHGTDLGNMDLFSEIEKSEYSLLATEIHEWEKVNNTLPVGVSVCARIAHTDKNGKT